MLLIKIAPVGGQNSYKAEVNTLRFTEQQPINFIFYLNAFANIIKN